jgi:hypothetical protein
MCISGSQKAYNVYKAVTYNRYLNVLWLWVVCLIPMYLHLSTSALPPAPFRTTRYSCCCLLSCCFPRVQFKIKILWSAFIQTPVRRPQRRLKRDCHMQRQSQDFDVGPSDVYFSETYISYHVHIVHIRVKEVTRPSVAAIVCCLSYDV